MIILNTTTIPHAHKTTFRTIIENIKKTVFGSSIELVKNTSHRAESVNKSKNPGGNTLFSQLKIRMQKFFNQIKSLFVKTENPTPVQEVKNVQDQHTIPPVTDTISRDVLSTDPANPQPAESKHSDEAWEPVTFSHGTQEDVIRPEAILGVNDGEQDFSAYLFARSMADKTTDNAQLLDRLRAANQSVNEARDLLHFGRGNVDVDVQKIENQTKLRIYFTRRILENILLQDQNPYVMPLAMKAAVAEFMGSGNCGEINSVVIKRHIKRLETGEQVTLVESNKLDHCWAEMGTKEGVKITLDSWANGPAVLAKDGRFVLGAEDGQFALSDETNPLKFSYDQSSGKNLERRAKAYHDKLDNQKAKNIDRWNKFKANSPNVGGKIWEEQPVISPELQQDIDNKFSQRDELLQRELVKHTDITEQGLQKQNDNRLRLNKEIRAVGVARSLGANVTGALRQKDTIIEAYETRFKQGFRGRWKSE